jgi:hypothetical protein
LRDEIRKSGGDIIDDLQLAVWDLQLTGGRHSGVHPFVPVGLEQPRRL